MSRNWREATGQRNLGNVIRPGGEKSQVEIIDDEDDEVEEISSGFRRAATDRTSRLRTRRQRREAIHELQFSSNNGIDEEWEQLQQALMMSTIEAERLEERRKMCGTLQDVMSLQVEVEPLSPKLLKSFASETTRTTKGIERDEREDTASPELFSTPPEEQEQLTISKDAENIESDTELHVSPTLPVTMTSPDAVPDNKDESVRGTSTSRQEIGGARQKLKLRRTRVKESDLEEHNDKIFDDEPTCKSTKRILETNEDELHCGQSKDGEDTVQGEKHKLEQDDDATDDEDIPMTRRTSLKRKKLSPFEETSDTDDQKEVEEKVSKRPLDDINDPQPKRIAINESDQEDALEERSACSRKGMEPGMENKQQKTSTGLLHVRLARRYKKSRCRPTTLKEAMKANLCFAPPGFDLAAYTLLIIRMFEKYRIQLHMAQSKVHTLVPWGNPVSCGKIQGKSLDAQLPGKASTSLGGKSSAFVRGMPRTTKSADVKTQLEQELFYQRRTLRSSANLLSQASASTTTSTAARETSALCKVDSDSDDGNLMTSYLDKVMPSTLNASTKKTQRAAEHDGTSDETVTGTSKTTNQVPDAPTVTMHTSSQSSLGVADNDRTSKIQSQFSSSLTETSSADGSGTSDILFGANVVLDSNMSEIHANVANLPDQIFQEDRKAMSKSKADENTRDGDTSLSKGEGSVEANVDSDDNQSDFIQLRKRKSILQPLDDDSDNDESNLSQPVVSLHPPIRDSPVDYEMSSSKEDSNMKLSSSIGQGRDEAMSDDVTPLDSQSVMTQSKSQGILGKSILETMATEGETLLPSQALSDAESTSHKLITDTVQETGTRGSSCSAARPLGKQRAEKLRKDELFTIDEVSDDSLHVLLTRSEAAEKAAAAAMRRQQMTRGGGSRETNSSSVATNKPEEITKTTWKDSAVQCPLCYQHFSSKEIEAHASDCQGEPSSPQPSHSHSQRTEPSVSSSPTCAKPKSSIYLKKTGESRVLKHLKVVLESSPLAEKKLRQKNIQPTDSVKRNLDFEKSVRPSRSLDQYVRPLASSSRSFDQGSRTHGRNNGAALRTESKSEHSGYENEKVDESSEVYSWLDSSSPKKKTPHLAYARNASSRCEDYIPLNITNESENDGSFARKSSTRRDRKERASRSETIESDSESSDDYSIMVQYGSQKAKSDAEMDENELALDLLGGKRKKRPRSLSKSSKAKKRRRRSDSCSEDSDELSIVCHLCNEKIPKELYEQHAEEELKEKKRKDIATEKWEEVTVKDRKKEDSKVEERWFAKRVKAHEDPPSQSSETEHRDSDQTEHAVDWDSVSDSPIKCFQFTGNSASGVDFDNQFEHLKETKRGGRRGNRGRYVVGKSGPRGGPGQSNSRGGYGEFSDRGNYKAPYRKVYGRGRGKKYGGKFRGYRGKK